MGNKNNDVIRGRAQLSTGAVEAVLDLKRQRVTVTLDTNNDGRLDTAILGAPESRLQPDSLAAMLYNDAVKLGRDGALNESDVRSLGILARGINDINRGSGR